LRTERGWSYTLGVLGGVLGFLFAGVGSFLLFLTQECIGPKCLGGNIAAATLIGLLGAGAGAMVGRLVGFFADSRTPPKGPHAIPFDRNRRTRPDR